MAESCNGIDDDCDGEVDEVDSDDDDATPADDDDDDDDDLAPPTGNNGDDDDDLELGREEPNFGCSCHAAGLTAAASWLAPLLLLAARIRRRR